MGQGDVNEAKFFHLKPNQILKLVSRNSSDLEYDPEQSLFLKKKTKKNRQSACPLHDIVHVAYVIMVNDAVTIVCHKRENPWLCFSSIARVTTKFSVLQKSSDHKVIVELPCLWVVEVQTSLKGSLLIGTVQYRPINRLFHLTTQIFTDNCWSSLHQSQGSVSQRYLERLG